MTSPPPSVAMYYGERTPSPALGLHVAAYWSFRVAPGISPTSHTVPPDGCASLFVDARRGWAGLVGPQGFSDQAHLVREIRRLLGLPPRDLRAYLSGIAHGAIVDR